MKSKYSTLLLLLATIGCKQEVMAQVKPAPIYQHCGRGTVEKDVYGCWRDNAACTSKDISKGTSCREWKDGKVVGPSFGPCYGCDHNGSAIAWGPFKDEPVGVEKGDDGDRIPLQVGTNLDGSYIFTENFAKSVSVESRESTAVKLSDEEYSNLQKLRQAVVDEEKRLAVKYGADLNYWCGEAGDVCKWPDGWRPDIYTFHQQFLLIDKAEPTIAFPAHWGEEGQNKPKQWGSGISGRLVMPKSTPPPDNALILNRFPDGSVLRGAK